MFFSEKSAATLLSNPYAALRKHCASLQRLLPAFGFALSSTLAHADNSAPLAATTPMPAQTSAALAEESKVERDSERSLLHSVGLLETAGTFDAPKMPAASPPAGLFGVYMIPQGKVVVNYLPIWSHYNGLQSGTSTINSAQAATAVPAYNTKSTQMVRTLPTQLDGSGQLLAGMYGITNYLNIILMPSYIEKNAGYVTYGGASGATPIGVGNVSSNGVGDTYASLLVKLYEGYNQELLFSWGLSFPTGSITQNGGVLASNGKIVNTRLPYGMQLGDGTYDGLPSLAYTGNYQYFAWGVMTRARLPLQSYNSQGWRQGNLFEGTGWVGYDFIPPYLSATLRVTGSSQDSVHGVDPLISGLGVAGNPNFYGGQMVKGLIGLSGRLPVAQINGGGRIALEAGMPLYLNLNGVQIPEKWSLQLSAAILF
jgi:hypothetical protein